MDDARRDNTEDWLVPEGSVPLLSQLEARIDEALVIARASEEGLREVGGMALDAARQARRAAEAAEASARSAAEVAKAKASGPAGPVTAGDPPPLPVAGASSGAVRPAAPPPGAEAPGEPPPASRARFDVRFRDFNERADRVSARLRALGNHPREPATASFAPARRRGDG